MAWAINELERRKTAEEAEQFFARLVTHRESTWGMRRWPGAKQHDRFLRHVAEIATAFTTNAAYRNRRIPPAR